MILSAITTTDFSSSLYAETSLNLPAGAPFAGRNSHIPLEITGKCKDVAETCQCHSIVNGLHAFDRKACKSCGKCEEECPSNALELFGKEITLEDAAAKLLEDRLFYSDGGGITISGGEPLLQNAFCAELLKQMKAQEI